MEVAVSFIKGIYNDKKTIELINNSIANYIHVDIMDGIFVENKNYTTSEINKLLTNTSKPLDVHLMVKNPLKYLNDFAMLNTEYLTFHYEAIKNIEELINEIKLVGLKVGISIKPNTSVNELKPYLKLIDKILVMSVEPGKGGQEFIESTFNKIKELDTLRKELNLNFKISVDGGVNDTNAQELKELGVDILAVGTFVTNYENFNERIKLLKYNY